MLTVPQRLRQALTGAPPRTLKELSGELSASEKELALALEKLQLSLRHAAVQLGVEPARCIACGFEFESRGRVSKPSRCPNCRSERIQPARFWIG
jgi:predicted Zn-ribbon and HTH transcriptional regulator